MDQSKNAATPKGFHLLKVQVYGDMSHALSIAIMQFGTPPQRYVLREPHKLILQSLIELEELFVFIKFL